PARASPRPTPPEERLGAGVLAPAPGRERIRLRAGLSLDGTGGRQGPACSVGCNRADQQHRGRSRRGGRTLSPVSRTAREATLAPQAALERLRSTLLEGVPSVRYLGIEVVGYDGNVLVLGAPFALNINEHRTAFAGSLNTLVTLAGWGLAWL